MKNIYLDWAATGIPESRKENSPNVFANPSSIHTMGVQSRQLLESARDTLSNFLGVSNREIIFTSGGTEANNIAILSPLNNINIKTILKKTPKIITTNIEHPSVYEPINFLTRFGFQVTYIDPEQNGIINPERILDALDNNVTMISVMTVNNETGAIQPIEEIAKIIEEYSEKVGKKIIFHTDAVQALGKILFQPKQHGVDAASFSAHKLGAPKGVGALYIGENTNISSPFKGGGQEFNKRPGTENLEGITAFVNILAEKLPEIEKNHTKASLLCKTLIEQIVNITGAIVIPKERLNKPENYSPYIIDISFPPIPSEVLVRTFAQKGLMISAGSACSSHKKQKRGRVLQAMGLSEKVINSTVRFSLGYSTTGEQIEETIEIVKKCIERLSKYA